MRSSKKKTLILIWALSAILFVGCGKNSESADAGDAAPVESIAEPAQENVAETTEQVDLDESASSDSATEIDGEETVGDASGEDTPANATTNDKDTNTDNTDETAQGPTQENAQATDGFQMVDGVDYSEWTQRQTWTASNGVVLKIKDNVNLNAQGFASYVIVDGDVHPDSPYTIALNEYTGQLYLQDIPSDLPDISNSSFKRTSFPNTDPVFLEYQSIVNRTLVQQGAWGGCGLYSDGIATGVIDGNDFWWDLYYTDSHWEVKIYRNMPMAAWYCLRDCIKMVSPDGQLIYDVIYTDFFEGSEYIPDYYMWCPVGGSEIYQPEPFGYGYPVHYSFR